MAHVPADAVDQRMLELIYGLVAEDEALRLREQIAAEPVAAEAYLRAQRIAGVFSVAAKWDEAPVSTQVLRARVVNGVESPSVPKPTILSSALRTPHSALNQESSAALRHALQWAVSLAATVLFAFLLGGYLHHRGRLSTVAQRHLRVTVTGPSQLAPGATNEFRIQTTDVLGNAQSAALFCTVCDPAGNELFAKQANTDVDGGFDLQLPLEGPLPPKAKLQVVAYHAGESYGVETAVPVSPYRFLTRISTDKPLFRPGEIVRYRSLTLGRFGLDTPGELPVHFETLDPSGAAIAGSEREGVTQRGVGNGEFVLPADCPGGEYTLVARCPSGAFPEEKQSFYVREYRTPRLKKDLEFIHDSYTPGDRVAADLSVQKAEGGPAANAQLSITATVDGQTVFQATDKTTANGAFRVEFDLPKGIERGDGQLAVQCDDGGVRETIAKSIPINLGKVEVFFCPEGGDLVAGLENRVYFKATNPLGKPVHVEGEIVDSDGNAIAQIETAHQGMGAFAFTPSAEATYQVRLNKPAAVQTASKLPAPNDSRAVVLSAGAGVFDAKEPIQATLRSTKADLPLVIAAYCRGVQVAHELVTLDKGENAISLAVPPEASGVIRLTAYDYRRISQDGPSQSKPQNEIHAVQPVPHAVAERLVYRRPDRRLQVRVANLDQRYTPGDTVELSLLALTEAGKPASSAVLGCAVVDDSVLKLADDDSPAMATHFYLTSEVEKPEDLEKADFYLSHGPQAEKALDLLLGTQGWRRFVERSQQEAQEQLEEAGKPLAPTPTVERLMALGGIALPPTVIDNLAEVRVHYEQAREQAEADYRAAADQLRRAAVYGGLSLIALLMVLYLPPFLLQPRDWKLSIAVRRLGPALTIAGLCLFVGLLWAPAASRSSGSSLSSSSLLALHEFRPQVVAATPAPAAHTWDFAYDADFGVQSLNPVDHYWYRGFQHRWADTKFTKRLSEQHHLAYFDLYRFDAWQKALQQRAPDLNGFIEIDFLPGLKQIVAAGHPRDVERVARLIQQIEDGEAFGRSALFDRLSALDNGYLAFKQRSGARVGYGFTSGDFDGLHDSIGQLYEQLRFPVREYAHQHVAASDGVRTDFAETVYWHPLLVADENGRATVTFDLADSVTSYRVLAEAHDGGGRIGTGAGEIVSRLPFTVEPKLPLEVNAGDRIEMPVAVSNDSSQPLETLLSCSVGDNVDRTLRVRSEAEQRVAISPKGRARTYFTLDVTGQKGMAQVEVRGTAVAHADAKRQSIRVVPPGFPVAESYAGRIDGQHEVTIDLPESMVSGTLEVTLAAYPSTLATLQSGLEGILREPTGCFEQASSSNYPNVLLLQYLEEHKVSRPDLTRRAKEYLSAGYAKLTGYECKSGGFEWFGNDPGHEALTAYGLMQFRDMAEVHAVDPALMERTANWLLSRRDGHGGFQRSDQKLDGFGSAPDHITNAYIVWALSESEQQGIEAELASVVEHARTSQDPYEIALAAASAVNGERLDAGRELLNKLVTLSQVDGRLVGTNGSITRSGGQALAIETTALATLAWLKLPEFRKHANRAIDWIVQNRSGDGSFGSTQATVLALKALVQHAKVSRAAVAAGDLVVTHDERVIGTQSFAADEVNAIQLAGLEAELTPGENELAISLTGKNQMPYTIDVSYCARSPQSDPDCAIGLSTRLSSTKLAAGETIALEAELINKSKQGQPMTVAVLGLPAGLQPRTDQLEELKKAGAFDYYETRGREVICYWRSLAPEQRVPLRLDLVAEWPGQYTGPASRAYLYYTAERKHWAEPLAVEIAR